MKLKKIHIMSIALAVILMIIVTLSGCSSQLNDKRIPVKVLILPKFEQCDMAGDFPGEAQYFYEEYLADGDVFVISAAVDFDLGHRADARELSNKTGTTWFHDGSFDDRAVVRLDQNLTDRVFNMVENLRLETTPETMEFLEREYPGEAWAQRQPKVMRGTSVTGDNYWKGIYDHENALLITETYNCADPYAITEMEDIAVGQAVKGFGLLERLIILRVAVNMDVFPTGITPEMLWGGDADDHVASENGIESVDSFETAMKNCFVTGKVLIDEILEGTI